MFINNLLLLLLGGTAPLERLPSLTAEDIGILTKQVLVFFRLKLVHCNRIISTFQGHR
jgi:hypothetical protein